MKRLFRSLLQTTYLEGCVVFSSNISMKYNKKPQARGRIPILLEILISGNIGQVNKKRP